MNKQRPRYLFIILILMAIFVCLPSTSFLYANIDTSSHEQELEENVDGQLDNLDFSDTEKLLEGLNDESLNIFGSTSFFDKVRQLINGDIQYTDFWGLLLNVFFEDVVNIVPTLATIIAIAVVLTMLSGLSENKKSISNIVQIACYVVAVTLIISVVVQMIALTTNTIESIKLQVEVVFPILLTLLTALGGTASVAVYQPAIATLSGGILLIFSKILLPIFLFAFVFAVLSNITDNIKFTKFVDFFSSSFKWLVGIVFTIFFAFVSIQGISAGSYDGISIRTAKYTIKNSIPIIGGYISDGFNFILTSSVLIKNAVGVTGLLLLLATCLMPILKIVVVSIGFKLTSAVLEPLGEGKICNLVSQTAKLFNLLITIIIGSAFAYMLIVGLVISTANTI